MSIKRILVVDNDRFFVEIITDILEEMGHHIQKVYDGMEAMQKLRKDIPDVIFTDLVMPKVDGERLIKYVRDNSKSCTIPIIIISGTVIEDNLRLKNIGADGFIPKGPVEKLKENITKVLEKIDKEGTTELLFEESATNVVRFKPRHVVKELLFSKRHGDLIIQKMTEGVIETDHNSMIINVNPQIIEIFQKKDWELVGTLIFDIFKAHNKERVKTIFKKLSQSPTMISKTTTISFNNKNLKLNFTNLIENNEYTGMLILIQDITPLTMKITRLKALNIKLEEAQAQLLQTAKFVALGELTANVSHEINNPLTTILGYASLLLRSLPHDDPNRKSFEIIENEAVRARSIISSLLDLAYQPEPVYEEIHIEEEIRNALPLIQKSCESAKIDVEIRCNEDLPSIIGDSNQLKQVFFNIANNAIDAMSQKGGVLTIELLRKGNEILWRFVDNGEGITKENIPKLFIPFFTTKKCRERVGTGLTISLGIIKRHGGTISVESEIGKGTAIIVKFPIVNKNSFSLQN